VTRYGTREAGRDRDWHTATTRGAATCGRAETKNSNSRRGN
jgi:hypothetical protein